MLKECDAGVLVDAKVSVEWRYHRGQNCSEHPPILQADSTCSRGKFGQDHSVPLIPIADPDDERLEVFRGLRDSERQFRRPPPSGDRVVSSCVVESGLVIGRAIARGMAPIAILIDGRLRDRCPWAESVECPVFVVAADVLQRLTGFGVIREAVGIFARPTPREYRDLLATSRRILILEGVVNPVNLGNIIRSAAALGIDATLCDPTSCDPLYRRAIRGSMGAVFDHPWAYVPAFPNGIEVLRAAGFFVIGLVAAPDAPSLSEVCADVPEKVALVLGNEGHGLTDPTRGVLDGAATVPMTGHVDSLNVGAAAAIACYELMRGVAPHRT